VEFSLLKPVASDRPCSPEPTFIILCAVDFFTAADRLPLPRIEDNVSPVVPPKHARSIAGFFYASLLARFPRLCFFLSDSPTNKLLVELF
jgi:hypothetical protein